MFKRSLAISALLLLSAPAIAADLPVKVRPLLAPTPVSTWTGFYAGANLGYGWRDNDEGLTSSVAGPAFGIAPVGTPLFGGARAFSTSSDGVTGGVQLGYNWQFAPSWVAGIETDIQWADLSSNATCIIACNVLIPPIPGVLGGFFPSNFTGLNVNQSIDWFGTLRLRVGPLVGQNLFYVTGGLAYGDVKTSSASNGQGTILGFPISTWSGAFSDSGMKLGWTLGAGIESKLTDSWSLKAEYLYVDLGETSDAYIINSVGVPTGVTATRKVDTDVTTHVVRVGVNYKFNGFLLP